MSPIVFPVPATEVQITVDEIIGNLTLEQQVELLVKLSNLLVNNYVLNPKRMNYSKAHQNFSKAHQNFSNKLQNPEALTNPQNFLGPNYETVLNFWWVIDGLTENQWNEVARRYDALDDAARIAARDAARDAAGYAARYAARSAAGYAAWSAAWDAAWDAAGYAARSAAWDAAWSAAWDATYELMGMHTLLGDGKDLLFVPLFNF